MGERSAGRERQTIFFMNITQKLVRIKNKFWVQSVQSLSLQANRTRVIYFYNGILRGNVIFFFLCGL